MHGYIEPSLLNVDCRRELQRDSARFMVCEGSGAKDVLQVPTPIGRSVAMLEGTVAKWKKQVFLLIRLSAQTWVLACSNLLIASERTP